MNSTVKNVYFLDHDAVKIHIQKGNGAEIDRNIDFTMSWAVYIKII